MSKQPNRHLHLALSVVSGALGWVLILAFAYGLYCYV